MLTNAREVSVEVLGKVLYQGAYSNIALDNAFSSASLKDEDTALVTEITYGTLKYLITIDMILERNMTISLKKVERDVLNILRISIYQMKYLDRIPSYAVINEAVNLTKKYSQKASGFVNGVLRGYLRKEGETYAFKDALLEDSFTYSFPLWMVKLFREQYGATYRKILEGLNERPSVTYRVNTLKMDREEALKVLESLGYHAHKTMISPYGIEVRGGKSVMENRLFREGALTVQDESSMLVAPALFEGSARSYMDLCSAPGGKATGIAELTGDKVPVYAFDIYENKLKLIRENKNRLGTTSIRPMMNDAKTFLPDFRGTSNVLLDAPCSGLGIIRKKPEIKYAKEQKDLSSLVLLQREILSVARQYVREEGLLVYSTCTLNKNENEENARWFLQENSEFEAYPLDLGKAENLIYTKEGFVTILPGNTMDGFFIARFRRKPGK